MAAYFLDTSALVKRYVSEAGTAWVNALLNPATRNLVVLSRIAVVELRAAVARRARSGSITPADAADVIRQFRSDLSTSYQLVELSSRLLDLAADVAERHALRAYDAVQLASALESRAALATLGIVPSLLSSDHDLNAAAQREGLNVEDPAAHP